MSPNVKFDIRYIADFSGEGKVEIFDNPDGLGSPIATKVTPNQANDLTLSFEVNAVVLADTKYHFKVTHHDPTGLNPDEVSPVPLAPVFTGVQAISNLFSSATQDTANVAWDANAIGTGNAVFGIGSTTQGPITDTQNIPNHAVTLTGLTAGTTYQFTVSNRHAIDGDALVSLSGQFTTQAPAPGPSPTSFTIVQPHAEPRNIDPGEVSTLSILAKNGANPVAGAVVQFAIDGSSQGSGTLSAAQATTNAQGLASVQFTGSTRGNVHVNISSAQATGGATKITVVVKKA